jgi:hypothetical protein
MHVIQAHRKRTGELRDLFSQLLGEELKMFEARSRSWALQVRGDSHREEDLEEIQQAIAGMEMEVEYLADKLRNFAATPPEPARETSAEG